MICFLTGSPVIPGTEVLNPANGLIDELRACFPENCRGLFICSDPDDTEKADFYAGCIKKSLENEGFRFRRYQILDGRNEAWAGKLIGQEYFVLEGTADEKDSEVLEAFIRQYYDQAQTVPPQVLLPTDLEETKIIHQWLRQKRGGKKIEIKVPHTGDAKDLVNMAAENAIETLRALRTQWTNDTNKQNEALAELQNALDLPQAPNRMECYDISNTQGTNSVGSMVVFLQGVPAKKHYRRFNIKTVEGPNDFDSMTEVLTRRLKRWEAAKEKNAETGGKADESFAMLPDLIIMDGGKGQLGRAVEVLDEFGLSDKVHVVGLAKREEELFLPHQSESILLPRHSQGLYMVQRIRDEAHRFAITAHRNRRTKAGLASQLEKNSRHRSRQTKGAAEEIRRPGRHCQRVNRRALPRQGHQPRPGPDDPRSP